MKKPQLNAWNGLSLRIVALFATAMLVSYSPDLLRGFFEDKYIQPDPIFDRRIGGGLIDNEWDWGYRHYLYFFMCVTLFIVQAARLMKWIDKNKTRFEP